MPYCSILTSLSIPHLSRHLVAIQIVQSTLIQVETNSSTFSLQLSTHLQYFFCNFLHFWRRPNRTCRPTACWRRRKILHPCSLLKSRGQSGWDDDDGENVMAIWNICGCALGNEWHLREHLCCVGLVGRRTSRDWRDARYGSSKKGGLSLVNCVCKCSIMADWLCMG